MNNLTPKTHFVNGLTENSLPQRSTPHTNGFDLAALAEECEVKPGTPKVATSTPQKQTMPSLDWTMPPLPDSARLDPSLGHNACTWLDRYVNYSRKWAPRGHEDSHAAAGLFILSTVAARRVRLDFGGYRYTNLYILQAIQTSIRAKTTTLKRATELLEAAGLDHLLLPDENTPQSMIKIMSTSIPDNWPALDEEVKDRLKRRLAFAGQRGWFYDEFGGKVKAMMNDNSVHSEFRTSFRKFDDNASSYIYNTIARSEETIKNPYLTLVGNATPADLKPFAKRGGALWNDGFWARFVLLATEPNATPSKERFPQERSTIPADLVTELNQWHKRLGVPTVTVTEFEGDKGTSNVLTIDPLPVNDCRLGAGVYEAFYTYSDALTDIITETGTTDLYGNYSRLPEKALRVAMLFASLENNGVIEIAHWAKAQEIAERWRQNLHNLYAELAEDKQSYKASIEEKVKAYLKEQGPKTAREIIRHIKGLDTQTGNSVIDSMVKVGELVSTPEGRTQLFALVQV